MSEETGKRILDEERNDVPEKPVEALPTNELNPVPETPSSQAEQAAKRDGETASAPEQPSDPSSKAHMRWAKPLIISLSCVLVVTIVVGGYFIWSAGEKRGIASDAVEALKVNPTVTELVIPSEWGDQSGFAIGGVDVDSVEYDPLKPNDAQVHITADIGNGTYEGLADYDVSMHRDGGAWSADAKQTSLSYHPISGVSEEVLVAKLPELIDEADRLFDVMDKGAGHIAASTLFGPDTTVVVEENDFDGKDDYVALALTTQKDGVAYEAAMDVQLEWLAPQDSEGDWHLVSASLDPGAFMAAASFPHDGMSTDKTEEEAAKVAATPVAQDEWRYRFLEKLGFAEGSPYAWVIFENVPNNNVDMTFAITVDGVVIYESPRISPNQTLEAIRISEPLPSGRYDANVRFTAYEPGTDTIIGEDDDQIEIEVQQPQLRDALEIS